MVLLVLQIHATEAVLQVLGPGTELAIAGDIAVKTEIEVVPHRALHALVAPFVLKAHGEIATVLITVCFNVVDTILHREGIVTVQTSFALRKVIADAVLAAELLNTQVRSCSPHLLDSCSDPLAMHGIAEIDGLDAALVLLLRELLIPHAVLLLEEPGTTEAIRTPEAVLAEPTISAISAVLTVIAHVTGEAIDALGTPFAVGAEREPRTARALAGITTVVHIFAVEDPEAVVAIFGLQSCINETTILRTHLLHIVTRFFEEEPMEVGEEGHNRTVEADVASMAHRK